MNIHPAFLINVKNLNLKYFILYYLKSLLPVTTQVSVQLSPWGLHPEAVQPLRAVRIPCY